MQRPSDPQQLISLIYGALLTASVRLGLGKHPYAIDPSKMSQMLKLYTMATPFGILVLALPTLAIAIVLADLIGSTRRHTWILYLFPVLQILIGIIGIILLFTQCKPASTLWRAQPGPRCLDPSRMTGYVYFMSGMLVIRSDWLTYQRTRSQSLHEF